MTANERKQPAGWELCKNSSANDCPPFGVVVVNGTTSRGGRAVLTCMRPSADTDGMTKTIAITNGQGIKAGKYGYVSFSLPRIVAYDSANTPADGEVWGPQANKFTIKKGNPGFLIVGSAITTTPVRVLVRPMVSAGFVAKATSSITARSGTTCGSGTVDLYYLSSSTITSLATGLTAKSWVATALSSGDYLWCHFDALGQLWVTNKDCTSVFG